MNSNLIPTVITDKNGKTTTVHKKASLPSSSGRAIPPVSSQSRVTKMVELEKLKEVPLASAYRLYMVMKHNKQRVSKKDREAMLSNLHPDTMMIIDEKLPEDRIPMYNAMIDYCMHDRKIEHLNNLAVAADVLLEADDIHQRIFHTYIAGLQMYRYSSDPYSDWSTASPREQEGVRALLRVSMGLGREYVAPNVYVDGKPRHIISEYDGLYNLCFRRPEDAEKIIHLLNSRHLPVDSERDIAVIEALLDQDAKPALVGGVL